MVRWSEFEGSALEMAEAGRTLFTQYGVGLGFLATVRPDGGPRLHPMCPVLAEGGLYAFIVPSPKQRDLLRDGRYAMHAFTPEDLDDEFCVIGRALRIEPGSLRDRLVSGYHGVIPEGLHVVRVRRGERAVVSVPAPRRLAAHVHGLEGAGLAVVPTEVVDTEEPPFTGNEEDV